MWLAGVDQRKRGSVSHPFVVVVVLLYKLTYSVVSFEALWKLCFT